MDPAILRLVGLVLDLLGVGLLFFFSPEQFPDPQWSAFFKVEGDAAKRREHWLKWQPRRRRIARGGFISLALGFTLQLFAEALVW